MFASTLCFINNMENSIIEIQIGILRSILGGIAEKELNNDLDFIKYANKYFGFDTHLGWNILMNAFYVFEDTELAKSHFEKSGVKGSNNHRDIGEKYLRLYGILNATYQQMSALINLVELFKIKSKTQISEQLKGTASIMLRNKIASHPSNYSTDFKSKSFDVYEISRPGLNSGKIRLLKNQEDFEDYELNEAIIEFNFKVEDILSKILKKFIKKKFNNQGEFHEKFLKVENRRAQITKN